MRDETEQIVYRDDMPKGFTIKLLPENVVLVGTGLKYTEGVDPNERVLPKTRR